MTVTARRRSRNKRDLDRDFLVVRAGEESGRGGAFAPAALPEKLRIPFAALSALSVVALLVLGLVYSGQSTGTAFDVTLRAGLSDVHSPWSQIALFVDWTGEPVGATLVLITLTVACVRLGHRRAAVLAVAGTALSVGATDLLKPLVGRTINDGFLSFPSGHTAAMTCYTLVVVLVLAERHRLGAVPAMLLTAALTLPAAATMAWAQVLMNAHYPTDAVGGLCTALAVVPPTAWLIDLVADRLPARV